MIFDFSCRATVSPCCFMYACVAPFSIWDAGVGELPDSSVDHADLDRLLRVSRSATQTGRQLFRSLSMSSSARRRALRWVRLRDAVVPALWSACPLTLGMMISSTLAHCSFAMVGGLTSR